MRFQYVQPTTLETALTVLMESGRTARLLAGGTDVLVRLRSGHMRPAIVVDVKRIDALDAEIGKTGTALRVGARCTIATLVADGRVRQLFPALVEAARVVGSVQIRNRATLVGNICNASPAADTAPALLSYGAIVNVAGTARNRCVPLSEFFRGPGQTVLAADELVTSIDLPVPSEPVGAAFTRLTRRRGVDLATLTVCCAITRSGKIRVALGAVAPTPLLICATTHEAGLPGDPASVETATSSIGANTWVATVAAQASPISDVRAGRDYRAAMLPVFIKRTVDLALRRLDENATWKRPESLSSSQ